MKVIILLVAVAFLGYAVVESEATCADGNCSGVQRYAAVNTSYTGSPIIHQVNDISNLVGVHKGGVCIFESSSENQTRIDVSGYSSLCDRNQYYYKVFSDWENVKSILNLQ